MKKLIRTLYWRLCRRIGYVLILRDYWDPETFTLKRTNSHIALLKYIGKEDHNGNIRVEEVWQMQIKKI